MQYIKTRFNKYKGNKISLSGLTDELLCIYLQNLLEEEKDDIVVVTSSLFEANSIYQSLLDKNIKVFLFPMDDFLISEVLTVSSDFEITRLETLINLTKTKTKKIVVTHLMGFLRYLPSRIIWQDKKIRLKRGLKISKEHLIEKLMDVGYKRTSLVSQTGEFGDRGFIIDVYLIGEEFPLRIEFWGNEIESLRFFDVDTQLSIRKIKDIIIYPFTEFLSNLNNQITKEQKYLFYYNKEVDNIVNYCNNPIIIYKDYNKIKKDNIYLQKQLDQYKIKKQENIKTNYMFKLQNLIYKKEIFVQGLEDFSVLNVDESFKYKSKEIEPFNYSIFSINKIINDYLSNGKTIIIYLDNEKDFKKLEGILKIKFLYTNDKQIYHKVVNFIKKKVNKGFVFEEFVVLTSFELFGIRNKKGFYKSHFRFSKKIKNFKNLTIGDYVVHNIHGIGIYEGLDTLIIKEKKKDYLKIRYKNEDYLYIPVEKIDFLFKYFSFEGSVPKINALGSVSWQRAKINVHKKVKDIAAKLLKTSILRETKKGFSFSKDGYEQKLFEEKFFYQETKDQLNAIKQIKDDMELLQPMDRVLCGDVGYGKTEVAFRAAFKAVNDNKQVAFLCPTTILSLQHYNNALDRFSQFPIRIELLNRFTPAKKVLEILKLLKEGIIDIVFGTHRLLSNDVNFKDLGLLIIDEEQRFGVIHKEKLKELKVNVDVLVLSATPIPRTLQLSLSGIKSLSLIETPPLNRFPIQTYVLEYDDFIIKEAIYKELARNGQVFFLYNKISNIIEKVFYLQRLIPEAKITYAHGQMSKLEIEERMISFIKKDYDILVCTTIIEIGIDIANVNTLIINDADMFGLSQLYQIRGRVGRSDKIAYAYLTYKKEKVLNENAIKRLNAIKEFTELGSGFGIALRDLSIRGAGNILGSEQAGYIDSIGIDLYLKMLNEEVNKLKNIKDDNFEQQDEKPLINIETHIDDNYVKDNDLKIEIHQKINEIDSLLKLSEIKEELEDRFGNISESMLLYMHQELFEKEAKKVGIIKVEEKLERIEFWFAERKEIKIDFSYIYGLVEKQPQLFNLKYRNNKLIFIIEIKKLKKHWLYLILEILHRIKKD